MTSRIAASQTLDSQSIAEVRPRARLARQWSARAESRHTFHDGTCNEPRVPALGSRPNSACRGKRSTRCLLQLAVRSSVTGQLAWLGSLGPRNMQQRSPGPHLRGRPGRPFGTRCSGTGLQYRGGSMRREGPLGREIQVGSTRCNVESGIVVAREFWGGEGAAKRKAKAQPAVGSRGGRSFPGPTTRLRSIKHNLNEIRGPRLAKSWPSPVSQCYHLLCA